MQLRPAYHSKLEVSSLSGDFKNAHRSPAEKFKRSLTARAHTHTPPLREAVFPWQVSGNGWRETHHSEGRTGSNEPRNYFDRCGHLVPCQSQTAAVTYRHEPAWNSIIRQILGNNFGISLLLSALGLSLGETHLQKCVLMRNAVPHACPSENLRNQDR